MIEIPTRINFSKMTFLQILIVIIKFVVYFDYNEIEELAGNMNQTGGYRNLFSQIGGSEGDSAPAAPAPAAPAAPAPAAPAAEAPAAPAAPPADLSALAGAAGAAGGPAAAMMPFIQASGLNKSVGGPLMAGAPAVAGKLSKGSLDMNKALSTDLSKDKDLKGVKKGFINNSWILEIIKTAMDIIMRVAKTAGAIVTRLFMIFIFAATFPALPFFAVMGFVYAFAKYGAFKFRGL